MTKTALALQATAPVAARLLHPLLAALRPPHAQADPVAAFPTHGPPRVPARLAAGEPAATAKGNAR